MKQLTHRKHLARFCTSVLLLLVMFSSEVLAQSQLLTQFTVNDGITSNTVYRCLQDSKGFMWFATESGVTRYDGYYFDRFTVRDGLSDNEVMNLFEDSSGRIWFLTLNGKLCFYLDGKVHNEQTDHWLGFGFNGMGIQNMFEDDLGNLYVSHFGNRIVRFGSNGVNKIFDLNFYEPSYNKCPTCGNNSSLFIYNANHTELFLYYNVFTLRYNPASDEFEKYKENQGIMRSAFFHENKHTGVFLNGKEELVLTRGAEEQVILNVGGEGYWAMRSSDGAYYYSLLDGTSWRVENGEKKELLSFRGLNINFIYEDTSNNLWVCSRSGIYQYSDEARKISFWNAPYDFANSKILSMVSDRKGSCYVGMYSNRLYSVSDTAVKSEEIWAKSEDFVRIKKLKWFGDTLLIATRGGVFMKLPNGEIVRKKVNVVSKFRGLGSVNDFARDQQGNLWIATSVGLLKADPRFDFTEQNVDLSFWEVRTSCVFVDSKNNLWYSDIEGLHKVPVADGKKDGRKTFCSERIVKVDETSDNVILALSESNGVYVCSNDGILATIPINACNKDMVLRGNELWVATNNGIYYFRLQAGQVIASDYYGFSDGLPSLEVTAIEVEQNRIYAGSSGGIAVLRMKHKNVEENVRLVYTRSVSGTWCCSAQDIDYLNNNITIDFSAVVQQQQEFLEFRYRFDSESVWKPISGRRLELSQLPYGTHSITIAARFLDGDWVEAEPVFFQVHPPFWYRWWFIVLVALLFLGLVWIVIFAASRRRLAKLEQRLAINQERERIAADLHDDIGADLTRISLNAEILKQSFTNTQQTGLANKIIAQSSDLRFKADQIIWALNPSYDNTFDLLANINSYLNSFLENTEVHFEVRNLASSNTPLSALQRRTIFMIVKELSNNTMKHSGASRIVIEVEEKGNTQIWTYADNGKGCSKEVFFGALRNGVRGMQNRLKEVDGSLAFCPSEEFLFCVQITMPLQPLSFIQLK